jgi:hypothetical protein
VGTGPLILANAWGGAWAAAWAGAWGNDWGQFTAETADEYTIVEQVAATTGLLGLDGGGVHIAALGAWANAQHMAGTTGVSTRGGHASRIALDYNAGVVGDLRPATLGNAGSNAHCARVTSIATVTQLNYNSSIDKVTNMAQVAKA